MKKCTLNIIKSVTTLEPEVFFTVADDVVKEVNAEKTKEKI